MNSIKENLIQIRKTLQRDVTLIAVSKMHPVDSILTAYHADQRHFGENRIVELEGKRAILDSLANDIIWHLIGSLQSNKVRKAVELSDYIHAVDSTKLLIKIDKTAKELHKKQKVFIEVNISGEESKHGFSPKELELEFATFKSLKNVEVVGFMTMAPANATERELHHYFSELNQLRQRIEHQYSISLPELSMGMSGDYLEAISEGATFVRIGTAIFAK